MSFITRCPACGTTFKVVADQLKISDGWVRCGHCADVFDATLSLQNWGPSQEPAGFSPDPPQRFLKSTLPPADAGREAVASRLKAAGPAAPGAAADGASATLAERSLTGQENDGASPAASPAAPPPTRAAATGAGGPPSVASPASEDLDPETTAPETAGQAAHPAAVGAARTPASDAASAPPVEPEPTTGSESRTSAGGAAALEPFAAAPVSAPSMPGEKPPVPDDPDDFDPFDDEGAGRSRPMPSRVPESSDPGRGQEALQTEPGFVRQARRHAFWRSRGVRTSLWALNALLAVLLVLQWAVHERDRLAARHESLAPWLTTLCRPLGCTLQPARQIEALAIDSSQLLRRVGSFYSFEFVLKNSAGMPVAMPALELSLTNLRDEVIVRRVFMPQELPDAPSTVPSDGVVQMDLRLSLSDQDASAMTGYRALVFYP